MPPDPNADNTNKNNVESLDQISNEENSLSSITSLQDSNSSDDDEDGIHQTQYAGYQLLMQDETHYIEGNSSEDDGQIENKRLSIKKVLDGEVSVTPSYELENDQIDYKSLVVEGFDHDDFIPSMNMSQDTPIEDKQSDNQRVNIEITESKADLIKKSMIGFSLPVVNIPTWAKNVTDEQLKEVIQKTKKNTK